MNTVPYTEAISRAEPACVLFLIDQSGSMKDAWSAGSGNKADGVATLINHTLAELALACQKEEELPRDYFHVGVFGYGTQIGPAFGGTLRGRQLAPISDVACNPLRVEQRNRKDVDDTGRVVEIPEQFPIWFDAQADGSTPMCQALRRATDILRDWVSAHMQSYAPIVVNITDGEATDGDPEAPARELTAIANENGSRVLLFNAHISSVQALSVAYPETEEGLPDRYAQMLFRMSSELTGSMRELASAAGRRVGPRSRGFLFNGGRIDLADLLERGTRSVSSAAQ